MVVADGVDTILRVTSPTARIDAIEQLVREARLDRGDAIRNDNDYQRLFAPHFTVRRSWNIRSGICDYGVYRLLRAD